MADRLPRVLVVRPRQGGVELDLEIQAELVCFRGHFPGFPILPGVVQLDWAIHFAREHGVACAPAARVFQVKFRSFIRPWDGVTLELRQESQKGQVTFEYRRETVVCSSGRLYMDDP
jgi:3-hydroxymyristoyl/3-hydroxydecanoyl-(acyl carrier protein) dehydratase